MNKRNNYAIQNEETNLVTYVIPQNDGPEVSLENYLKTVAKRMIDEMYCLVYGPISAWTLSFWLFNGKSC